MATRLVGDKYKVNVDDHGNLYVAGIAESRLSHWSVHEKRAYEVLSNFSPIAASGEKPIVWLENISDNMYFHIDHIKIGWNGGNATGNKCVYHYIWTEVPEPTANAVVGKFGPNNGPHNLNLSSVVKPRMNFQFWDNAGPDGMAIDFTNSRSLTRGISTKGENRIDYDGALIIPQNKTLAINLASEEDGVGHVSIVGFFKKDPSLNGNH